MDPNDLHAQAEEVRQKREQTRREIILLQQELKQLEIRENQLRSDEATARQIQTQEQSVQDIERRKNLPPSRPLI